MVVLSGIALEFPRVCVRARACLCERGWACRCVDACVGARAPGPPGGGEKGAQGRRHVLRPRRRPAAHSVGDARERHGGGGGRRAAEGVRRHPRAGRDLPRGSVPFPKHASGLPCRRRLGLSGNDHCLVEPTQPRPRAPRVEGAACRDHSVSGERRMTSASPSSRGGKQEHGTPRFLNRRKKNVLKNSLCG